MNHIIMRATPPKGSPIDILIDYGHVTVSGTGPQLGTRPSQRAGESRELRRFKLARQAVADKKERPSKGAMLLRALAQRATSHLVLRWVMKRALGKIAVGAMLSPFFLIMSALMFSQYFYDMRVIATYAILLSMAMIIFTVQGMMTHDEDRK